MLIFPGKGGLGGRRERKRMRKGGDLYERGKGEGREREESGE